MTKKINITKSQEKKIAQFQDLLNELFRESEIGSEREQISKINTLINRLLWGCK